MATKPILFSGPMVRAILADRKTQTRRVVKKSFIDDCTCLGATITDLSVDDLRYLNAPILPGDILWVRETWREWDSGMCGCGEFCTCPADGTPVYGADHHHPAEFVEFKPWRPSIFMPKHHCRLFLRVTGVRVQRVQDINELDAMAEGAEHVLVPPDGGSAPHVEGFHYLWDSINAKRGYGWDANPWVWVYGFECVAKPENWPVAA